MMESTKIALEMSRMARERAEQLERRASLSALVGAIMIVGAMITVIVLIG